MSALSVVTIDSDLLTLMDIVLRQEAREIQVDDADSLTLCQKLAVEMFELMYLSDGAGLAAPQVGIPIRLVVVDPSNLDFGPHVLINPTIQFKSETEEAANEGCLSIPRRVGRVFRSTEVVVHAYNLKGMLEEYSATGWLARVFQHEIEHLNGVLYPDRLRGNESLIVTEKAMRRKAEKTVKGLIK